MTQEPQIAQETGMTTLAWGEKDFGAITTSAGVIPVYRQRLSGKEGGKWMPHRGLIYCAGKTNPVVPDTREFWAHELPEGALGYGTKEVADACRALDEKELPVGRPSKPEEINRLGGSELGDELNAELELTDRLLRATDRAGFLGRPEVKAQEGAEPHWLVGKLAKLGRERLAGCGLPKLSKQMVATAIIILAAAAPAKGATSLEEINAAHAAIQSLTGKELKNLLQAIPEKQRITLVQLLPGKILPILIPREILAKNLGLAPEEELRKGFGKLTEKEFADTAAKADPETQKSLLDLLRKAMAEHPKKVQGAEVALR